MITRIAFSKMFPEKIRFWGRTKNASTLLSSTCVLKYLKNKKFIHIRERPARRLTRTDYQHVTANLGNIWETTNFLFRLKEKRMEFNAGGLSLSLDVLIYIIRYSKPKSRD